MLTLLGNPPLCCSQIMGSRTRRDGAFPTTTYLPCQLSFPTHYGFPPFSLPQLWAPPTLDCLTLMPLLPPLAYGLPHLLMGSPFFTIFIYLFIYYYLFLSRSSHHTVGAPSFAVELLPFSLLGSSPSHCGLLSFSLSHWAPPSLSMGPFRIALK